MKKLGLIFLAITIMAAPLIGCWSRRELDTLSIISAIGIDKSEEDGKLSVTFQIIKPSALKGSSSSEAAPSGSTGVLVLTSTGYTIIDAARNATMQSDRKLFFPQNKVIVVGEELAREGINPLLDFLNRDPEQRRSSWLLVAKGKAHDIINAKHEQVNIPAEAIVNMIKSSSNTSTAVKVDINEFIKNLTNPGSDPIACRIEMIQDDKTKNQKMRFTGTSVFKRDKLIGFLDQYETRGLNWVLGKVVSGIILVKSPLDENKDVALEIIRARSKITPEILNNDIKTIVEVDAEGNLAEQLSEVTLTNSEMFKKLEQRMAQVIKDEIQLVLEKAQKEWGVDIFGFGKAVHRKYPQVWKKLQSNWRELLSEVNVEIKVKAKIRSSGLSTIPTGAR